jgi:Uncharacterized protein conserved in bacteria C-term(DUF2220)
MSFALPAEDDVTGWMRRHLASADAARLSVQDDLLPSLYRRFPECRNVSGALSLLRKSIDRLAIEGALTLPKGPALYDESHVARLPHWVQKTKPAPTPATPPAPLHPLLRTGHGLGRRSAAKIAALNDFLRRRPDTLAVTAPSRERSLMIFGHDKMLDAAKDGVVQSFPDGHVLTLTDLGCRRIEAHLCFMPLQGPAIRREALLIENLTTYDSVIAWNERTRTYPVVILGNGSAVSNAPQRVCEIAARYGADSVRYFGDIDFSGLRIAADLARTLSVLGGLQCLPLAAAYSWLARYGRPVPAKMDEARDEAGRLAARHDEIAAWLGDDAVMAVAKRVIAKRRYIPQEWLGADVLRGAPSLMELPPPPYVPEIELFEGDGDEPAA